MDVVEAKAYVRTMDELFRMFDGGHQFTARDIQEIHKIWLGNIYEWAGKYRSVNLVKDDFPFATANLIDTLMKDFEKNVLKKHTPCNTKTRSRLIRSLAFVHTEFVLIHPFREGNGRVARMLSTLMALQAGLPPLDFNDIHGRIKREYFSAVGSGLDQNYKPMERIFGKVVRRTLLKLGKVVGSAHKRA